MAEFIAPSGAKVVINAASWREAKVLKKAIERELVSIGGIDIENLQADVVLRMILIVDSSDAVDAALWPCLVRCLYKEEKITETTFDKVEARGDYYDVVMACAKENLGPLVESLLSRYMLLGLKKKQAQSQSDTPK